MSSGSARYAGAYSSRLRGQTEALNATWQLLDRALKGRGGSFSQVESIDLRGTATPLHSHHNEEESFYVLESDVAVLVDGEWLDLSAGDFALIARGTPHAYVVRSERARMLVTFSPSGFEEAFTDLGLPVGDSLEPPIEPVIPSPAEMVAAFAPYGCEILGPPPALYA